MRPVWILSIGMLFLLWSGVRKMPPFAQCGQVIVKWNCTCCVQTIKYYFLTTEPACY
ncbi:hypothetical protein M758_5G157000 [Ceratodon purpureus]|nr:hypothetical protein M758_5G157000 [Ceratodon purpureus]